MAVITGPGMGNATGNKIPSGYRYGQLQKFTPEMMELWQSLFSHLGPDSYLSKLAGGDESLFKQMEAPALQQFSGLQGNIASRFSGMGSGARRSSGFQNTINQASSDFAQQLQSQRQSMQQQAIKDLLGLSGDLLGQSPHGQFLVKNKKQGFWQSLMGSGGGGGLLSGISSFF
jgi:hypothetical protein